MVATGQGTGARAHTLMESNRWMWRVETRPAGGRALVGDGGRVGRAVGPSSRPAVSPCSPAGGHPAWRPATHAARARPSAAWASPPVPSVPIEMHAAAFVAPLACSPARSRLHLSGHTRVAGPHVFLRHDACWPVHDRLIFAVFGFFRTFLEKRISHAWSTKCSLFAKPFQG